MARAQVVFFSAILGAMLPAPASARFLQVDPVGYKDQVNLYAYVANDPISGNDPDGRECVNASNGTSRCFGTGYNVTFPTPPGFRNTSPRASDYHQYVKPNISPRNATETREWVRNNPTPGNPLPATRQGTPNNATPAPFGGIEPSPVMSFVTRNTVTGNDVVVNATLPDHPLGNGVVIRDTVAGANGTSTIVNYGEGNGFWQSRHSPFAGIINNIWATPSMRPTDPNPPPPFSLCDSRPIAC